MEHRPSSRAFPARFGGWLAFLLALAGPCAAFPVGSPAGAAALVGHDALRRAGGVLPVGHDVLQGAGAAARSGPQGAAARRDFPASAGSGSRAQRSDGRTHPAGPAEGLETLEDPPDRVLPESHEVEVFHGGRSRLFDEGALEAMAGAVRYLLGPSWSMDGVATADGGKQEDARRPQRLHGPAVSLPGGNTVEGVRALLTSLPEVFGPSADADLRPLLAVSGPRQTGADPGRGDEDGGAGRRRAAIPLARPASVRMVQVLDGARVRGAELVAHFDDEGRLLSVSSTYRPGLRVVNRRRISEQDAAWIAREDLMTAEAGVQVLGSPSVEAWVWPLEAGPGHVWIVRLSTSRPWGYFVTRIDAASGRVLAREDLAAKGLRPGRGLVYRSNAEYPDHLSFEKLPGLYGLGRNPEGLLLGRHMGVLDGKEEAVSSSSFVYEYSPFSNRDRFDQVSAYYHLELAHERFARNLGVRHVAWFDDGSPARALVNVASYCGAYYSPDLKGDGVPGFLFGDQNTCAGFGNEDFARDADVVYHEFTHGVLDWSGIHLADAPPHSYQRALSEAVADFHAACFTGDPVIGEVVGITRDLDNAMLYPDDVACDSGFAEEHCTGQIWGGLLWDLRSVVKEGAERLEFASLDYLTDNWPDGHVVDEIDFWDAASALIDADRDRRDAVNHALIYGAAASRGILGPAPFSGDNVSILYERIPRESKFKSVGWIHKPRGRVDLFFKAPAGREVSIKVRGNGGLPPTFRLGDASVSPYAFFSDAVRPVGTEAHLRTVPPSASPLYVLEISSEDEAATGSFQVSIVVH